MQSIKLIVWINLAHSAKTTVGYIEVTADPKNPEALERSKGRSAENHSQKQSFLEEPKLFGLLFLKVQPP
jgi:hypothetical protein